MRIENLDWQNRVIFVPDSKTAEGRRLVPMSGRVFDILRIRCDAKQEGWVFPSKRSASGHRDVKTAMHYQHPELEIVRAALDSRPTNSETAA
jgi:integrase